MAIDLPPELASFVRQLVADRRFLSEDDVLVEGVRLLRAQETLREDVRRGFGQLDGGASAAGDAVFSRAEARIDEVARVRPA